MSEKQPITSESVMGQAQVFASAWSLVGGPFDDGTAMDTATREKKELNKMVLKLELQREKLLNALKGANEHGGTLAGDFDEIIAEVEATC